MAEVRRVRADEWRAWRDLRLRALRQAPEAFGSTYAGELELPDDEWARRTEFAATAGERAIFIAEEDGAWVGCAGIFPDRGIAEVQSMWVDPAHRGRGVGVALLKAAVDFGRPIGGGVVRLCLMPGNEGAAAFYERFGFRRTGSLVPMHRDPAVMLVEMELGEARG